jgi:hypothetical protein
VILLGGRKKTDFLRDRIPVRVMFGSDTAFSETVLRRKNSPIDDHGQTAVA